MSDLLPEVDHIATGLARVITQYRGRPYFNLLLAVYLEQVQHIEDAIHDVVDTWKLDSATGWRLDALGDLVGQPRIGDNDDVFRTYVKARILANRSDSKFGTMAAIADMLIPGWRYEELPMDLFFEYFLPEDYDGTTVHSVMQAVHSILQFAAGATYRVHLAWYPPGVPFLFAVTGDTETDSDNGFAATGDVTGFTPGNLAAGI